MKSVHKIVKYVLENYPDSRRDDFALIGRVYMALEEDTLIKKTFIDVMLNHRKYNLPSFHTITRARRKIFEQHPELKPKEATKKRAEEEKKFRRYAKHE